MRARSASNNPALSVQVKALQDRQEAFKAADAAYLLAVSKEKRCRECAVAAQDYPKRN